MTNREWLGTLSDKDLAIWMGCMRMFTVPEHLSPSRADVVSMYTDSIGGLEIWLKEERVHKETER